MRGFCRSREFPGGDLRQSRLIACETNYMDLLHKVRTDLQHLERATEGGQHDLALAAAKRARRNVTMLIRQIAEQRDNATTQEGTS